MASWTDGQVSRGLTVGGDGSTWQGLVGDVEDHVLVTLFAADRHPERADLADADGQGGLAFERAGERDRCERTPPGHLPGRNQALPYTWRLLPRLVTLVV